MLKLVGMKHFGLFAGLFLIFTLYPLRFPLETLAVVDPLKVPNNKVGIHIISPSDDEINPAAELANTQGDWGYITVLIQDNDRKIDKWQQFFNQLRKKHLIPIVRLTTHPEGDFWKRPAEGEAEQWAQFLDQLNWPTKNRYITIYNEPNHAKEWGNTVEAADYAKVLDQTITSLKARNDNFFVLNAGLDSSAPQKIPAYQNEAEFLKEIDQAVPGIFNKLDGWVSHSYPNPGFLGKPTDRGRGTVRTWEWELQELKKLGLTKDLPVFITETGWKHSGGKTPNRNFPTEETVAKYYTDAFANAWKSDKIVTVTPFLLNYQDPPFDQFSFKRITGEQQKVKLISENGQVLGEEHSDYYAHFFALRDMPKTIGQPVQENKGQLIKGLIFSSLVAGETYTTPLTIKNTGQSIWSQGTKLIPGEGGRALGISTIEIPKGTSIEPGQDYTFPIRFTVPQYGIYKVSLQLYQGDRAFESQPFQFTSQVKSPVVIQVKSSLKWKNTSAGDYLLTVASDVGTTVKNITLGANGSSDEVQARYLLPDYEFEFTLEKSFYEKKTIHQRVTSGVNVLDFGQLQPDIPSALLNPSQLWQLLPISN